MNNKICDICGMNFQSIDEKDNLCPDCVEQIILDEIETEENRYVQITRDMAMDAGDLSLEGQWIKW
jgi:DNA-directed RNA polymerase subunit RPC12/RpoP